MSILIKEERDPYTYCKPRNIGVRLNLMNLAIQFKINLRQTYRPRWVKGHIEPRDSTRTNVLDCAHVL